MPRAPAGKWASCIRVVEPTTRQTLSLFELEDNEAAVSIAMVPLRDRAGETFVMVGEKQQAHDAPVWSVGFNGEGTRIVSGGSDKAIKLWGALGGLIGEWRGTGKGGSVGGGFGAD